MSQQPRVHDVTSPDFAREVLQSDLPVLVDFAATWCGPCRMLEPVLDDLASEYADRAKVVRVDIDQSPELATSFGVSAVPTLVFFRDGEVVDRAVGLLPAPRLGGKLAAVVAAA
jgi:thioredoxin 1